ncbi:ninjurin-1-like isoform X1 [Penaeus japonicus]|uniref:ninjurin-1-like isoform X1 n=1 Tax=Penaeus japonicus TaxID=27405 RepID=UPI001C70D768|nr:ninjurin-1-like isoform X1 [Penaeus japonicus]
MSDRLFTPTNKVDEVKNRNGTMSVEPQVMTVGGGKTLDPNRYATKKTVAQGMLDIALLTANASQLKYVLRIGEKHEFYSLMLGLIITSLVLQVLVGVFFLIIGGMDINDPKQHTVADILNNVILLFVFLISVDNVVLSSFGLEQMNIHPPGTPINGTTSKEL